MALRTKLPCLACRRYSTFPSPQPSTSKQTLYEPPLVEIQSHLSHLLHPLPALPDRLALRLVTHKSALTHKLGNHNARPAFYGRRILRMHLGLLLSSQSSPTVDLLASGGSLLSAALDTHELGIRAGKDLHLERVMRWRAVLDQSGKESGLFKIRGETLQALVAGIWSHYGANTSLRFISSRVLPRLNLPPLLGPTIQAMARQDADLSLPGNSLLSLQQSVARHGNHEPLGQAIADQLPPLRAAAAGA